MSEKLIDLMCKAGNLVMCVLVVLAHVLCIAIPWVIVFSYGVNAIGIIASICWDFLFICMAMSATRGGVVTVPFNRNPARLSKQPCTRDCKDRCPGCAVTCERWAEYVARRDEDYARRKEKKAVSDALCDGYSRLAKIARRQR